MKYIKRFSYSLGALFFAAITLSAAITHVNALASIPPLAPKTPGEALEIAPPLIYLNANPGQTITTQIQIRDISSGKLLVFGRANDFVAAGTNGDPKILFKSSPKTDPFSMKSWFAPLPEIILKPEQTNNMTVTINVPRNASPGGHYSVIRFSATPPSLSGKSGVALSASLGSLILLTVSGHIVQNLAITKFYTTNESAKASSFFQTLPLNFAEKFKNTGNVALQPQGQVVVKDMFGKQLISMNINPLTGNVLPDSSRVFSQTLNSTIIGNKHLFGRYTAYLNSTYGSGNKTLTAKLTFWVIPVVPIVIIVLALIIGFFLLRSLIKRYNKHILEKAKKSSSR